MVRTATKTAAKGAATAGVPARHVVGPVPLLARLAGALTVLAGALLTAAPFLPYLSVGTGPVGGTVTVIPAYGVLDGLAAVIWPVTLLAAGASVAAGRLPRLGLATMGGAGALSTGLALRTLYQLQEAGKHRGTEIFFGRRLATSALEPLSGVWTYLVGYGLLVVVLVLTSVAWPRSTMDDVGDFDGRRPLVTGLAAVSGVLAGVAVAARPQDVPDRVVQAVSGFVTTIEQAGEVSLPDRLGLDLLGTSLLAGAALLVALVAATLRPRLATVGAFGGLAAYFLSSAVALLLEAGRYDDVVIAPGALLQLVAALAFAGLTAWCLRAPGRPSSASAQVAMLVAARLLPSSRARRRAS